MVFPAVPTRAEYFERIGIAVDDLQTAIANLEAKGAEFLMKPRDGKGRIAFVRGPDAVSIELVQTPV